MKKIAIIPARSGSKGLKNKNIIELCGKPLMVYSIEAAISSALFEEIILSTDSEEYGKIGASYGVTVMYRTKELSDDNATTYDVLFDVLTKYNSYFDYFMLLQPTSPMRTATHICEAVSIFERNYSNFDFLVSVKEAESAGVLVKPIDEDKSLKYFDTDFSNYKRQNYKEYSPNGAIFIAKPDAYLKQKHFFGKKSISYVMNKIDSIDIDDQLDYEFACLCMKQRMEGI